MKCKWCELKKGNGFAFSSYRECPGKIISFGFCPPFLKQVGSTSFLGVGFIDLRYTTIIFTRYQLLTASTLLLWVKKSSNHFLLIIFPVHGKLF